MHRALQSLVAALCICAPLPAFAVPTQTPLVFSEVKNRSGSVADGRIFTQQDATTPVSDLDLMVLAGLDRQGRNQGGLAAVTAEMILDTPVADGDEYPRLQDAVARHGATITAGMQGQSVHFYVESRNEDLAEVTQLFSQALAAPAFDKATFDVALAAVRARQETLSTNPLSIGTLLFRDAYYATSNAGQPPLGTRAELSSLRVGDTATFFRNAYRRGGAIAGVVGDTSDVNTAAAQALLARLAPGQSAPYLVRGRQALIPQTSILAFRRVAAPWVMLGFPAPTPNSDDFGAMLVLNSILADTFVRQSTTTVPLAERPVGVEYDFHSSPANVIFYVDGAAVDQSVALRELGILRLALSATSTKAEYLQRYKHIATGTYIQSVSSLSQRSEEIVSLANVGMGVDGLNTVLKKIDAVTPADLQHVIKKYFDSSTAAFVVPRREEQR